MPYFPQYFIVFIFYIIFHNIFQTLSKRFFSLKDLIFNAHLSQATTVHAKKQINTKHFPCKEMLNRKNKCLHVTTKQRFFCSCPLRATPLPARMPCPLQASQLPAWMPWCQPVCGSNSVGVWYCQDSCTKQAPYYPQDGGNWGSNWNRFQGGLNFRCNHRPDYINQV